MHLLKGKVAIVTGASSGIGKAAAKRFAAEGASVVAAGRRQQELDSLVVEIERMGAPAMALAGDLRDEDYVAALVKLATESFGGLDIAFNNAGAVLHAKPVHEMTLQEWQETIDVNLNSAFLCARHQVPALQARGGGSLVFTSSFVGGDVGFPGMSAYAAAKAGICGLARALAVEHGSAGIRVNTILPGAVDTPSNIANDPNSGPEVRAFVEGLHALKRMATADEIADVALFLASSASAFVTGAAIRADGGVSVNRT